MKLKDTKFNNLLKYLQRNANLLMMLNLLDCRLLGGNIKLTMYFNFNNTVQDPVNTKVPAAKYYKRITIP